MYSVTIPKRLYELARRRGIDVESRLVELLAREVGLDPAEEAEAHLELSLKYLEEGKRLVDNDPVQASEKLYKAAEEAVKALTLSLNISNIIEKVREKGRWTVTELEKAARTLSQRIGSWLYDAWDHAWILHVWGFHEAKLDAEAVKARLPYVERMVRAAAKILKEKRASRDRAS